MGRSDARDQGGLQARLKAKGIDYSFDEWDESPGFPPVKKAKASPKLEAAAKSPKQEPKKSSPKLSPKVSPKVSPKSSPKLSPKAKAGKESPKLEAMRRRRRT